MEEKILQTLTHLNELLGDAPYKLDFIEPKSIRLLDKNARYMPHEMFQNLVNNVKRDGALSSLPLCYRDGDSLIVLSGNHRVQAAVHAGLERILVLIINKKLDHQEQVAIQLSHNAIDGKDDPVILKELWDEIIDIDLKMYAGLDSETIKDLEKMEFATISEVAPDFKQISMLFLPEEVEDIKKLLEDTDDLFAADEAYILSRSHFEQVFRMLIDIKQSHKIVNNPTAFMKIIGLARSYMDSEEFKKDAKEEGVKNHAT